MASATKLSYHKQLFFILLIFLWTIILCFIGFQYLREKQYKSESLNAQLQLYNNQLLATIENNLSFGNSNFITAEPFDNLRVSIISIDGTVVYDNKLSLDSLDNHILRPEIASALKFGSGYHISRQSVSDGCNYFYSATRGSDVIVRTAIPYSSSLRELLRAEWSFLSVMISISLIVSVIAYFITQRLGKSIERINFYEAEQEKNRLKRQLTNNINHELKTPIASIQVCLETLLSGINLSEEKRQELIERCYTNNERLRKLLADVSLITRMEDGSSLIGKEKVLINTIIEELESEMQIMPEDERLSLHNNFNAQVVIEGNISLIGSIFQNLTENAIAYSKGKNIYITLLENTETECKIRFEDDGCGVEEKQLSRLFERFYRVDKGRSRQLGGTGLGLAIVKHAVQFHGGTISVSNRPNGGLRFDFSLQKHTLSLCISQ